MKKPKNSAKDLTSREQIVNAAVHLFGAKGYNGTTMRDIAQAVSMLPGSLYAHIDSKENLLAEIVKDGIEPYLEILRNIEGLKKPASEKLRAYILAHVNVVAQNPKLTFVVFHEWRFLDEPHRAEAVLLRRRYSTAITRIVEEGVASGDFASDLVVRIAVFTILGALNWLPEWYSPKGPSSPQAIGNRLADTLLGGLRSR